MLEELLPHATKFTLYHILSNPFIPLKTLLKALGSRPKQQRFIQAVLLMSAFERRLSF